MQDTYVLQQMLLLSSWTAAATQIYSYLVHLRYAPFLESDQVHAQNNVQWFATNKLWPVAWLSTGRNRDTWEKGSKLCKKKKVLSITGQNPEDSLSVRLWIAYVFIHVVTSIRYY